MNKIFLLTSTEKFKKINELCRWRKNKRYQTCYFRYMHMRVIAFLVFPILFLVACGQTSDSGVQVTNNQNGVASGHIIVAGSTTVTPLMNALVADFTSSIENNITIEVQELGTTSGINATIEGVSSIAMSSRSLSEGEMAQGLSPINIAMDGVGIIVNANNPVNSLTREQITNIFRGYITNWSEVGGNDELITVVSREAGSGIRTTFETFANVYDIVQVGDNMVQTSAVSRSAIISSGTGGVVASVSSNVNAIGYVTTGVTNLENLQSVAIDGVIFSEAAVHDGSYPFANFFILGVMPNLDYVSQYFIDWILSEEGQTSVSNAEYVRVH